jgi:pimeloyl-ACP methyl ester carboxylesterase
VNADDRFFDSDGVKIRFVDQGPRDGESVVLIHGGFNNIEAQWVEPGVIDALDDVYRVIAMDLRGHGKSGKPHEPENYGDAVVDDAINLLDHLGIEKAHFVGYSLGGRIVFRLIADHPRRLISAMPNGTDGEGFSPEGLAMLERVANSLEESGSIRPVLEHFNTDGAMTEEQIEQTVETFRAVNDAKALAAAIRSASELRPERSRLESNRIPSRCVIGEHDNNRPALENTLDYMPNLDAIVLDGVNHVTACRVPAFATAIRTFLDEQSTSRDLVFASDERSEQELIEEATSALPAHLREEADVVTTRPDGTEQILRNHSNGFVCSTDGSSDALYQRAFKVACRELSFHRYRAQILPILQQGSDPAERLAGIEAGIESGSITPPKPGAQGYYLSGPDRERATLLVVIMLPGATAGSTGLPTQRSDRTWLMCPGTPTAHIMIGDVPYGQDEDYWKTCGQPVSRSN